MIFISINHETCLSVFYATVFYYIIYMRSSKTSDIYNKFTLSEIQQNLENKAVAMQVDEESVIGDDNQNLLNKLP